MFFIYVYNLQTLVYLSIAPCNLLGAACLLRMPYQCTASFLSLCEQIPRLLHDGNSRPLARDRDLFMVDDPIVRFCYLSLSFYSLRSRLPSIRYFLFASCDIITPFPSPPWRPSCCCCCGAADSHFRVCPGWPCAGSTSRRGSCYAG